MKSVIESLMLILLITGSCFVIEAQQNNQFLSSQKLSLTGTVSGEGKFLKDLTAADFEIYLEKKRGLVTSIKQKNEPVSIGFLVDVSASMRGYRSGKSDKVAFAVKAFSNFLINANRENDYFIMTFGKDINLLLDSTQDGEKVKKILGDLAENKLRESDTKLYEAVKTSFEKIRNAKNGKKVLILVSDGQDNSNARFDLGDIEKLVKQNDVLLYCIRAIPEEFFEDSQTLTLSLRRIPIFEREYKELQFEIAPFPTGYSNAFLNSINILDDLSSASGGRGFYPLNQAETDKAFEILVDELKSQYCLEVSLPADLKKVRASEVKIKIPKLKDAKKVSVRTRKEIYF